MTGEEIENGELRMESWKEYKLGELAEISSSKRIYAKEYMKSGIPFYRSKEIIEKSNGNDISTELYISKERFNELKNKFGVPKQGDILLTSVGTLGIPYIVKEEEFYFKDGNLTWLKNFKSDCCNKFIYYWLLSDYGKNQINSRCIGSTQKALTIDTLKKFDVIMPSLLEQKSIAHILSTIDEKIETNNQINKKLEEMAQAIFKQWFVDFEFPCIPKNYKFSGAGKPCNPRGAGKPDDYDKVLTYNRVGGLPVPDGKSWFVYVLLCDDGSFYKGMTKDLYRRFYEHYTGIGAEWTKIHKPLKVIHYEKFNSQQEARKMEEELKSGYGREWIKREYKKYQEGLLAHEMKAGLSAHEMKAGSPAHQTHLMIAGEMVESELGMIPKGWKVGSISDFGEVVGGATPSKKHEEYFVENGIPWITPKNLSNDNSLFISKGAMDITEEAYKNTSVKRMPRGTVLFSSRAPIGYIAIAKNEVTTNQGFKSIVPNIERGFGSEYIYCWLRDNLELIESRASGSTFKEISGSEMKKISAIIPMQDILEKFKSVLIINFKCIEMKEYESSKLKEIRDVILPKLMSGEIRVPLE